MKSFQKLSLLLFAIVLFGCSKHPQQLTINDAMDLEKSFSDILKNGYGLFVNKDIKVTTTNEFHKFNLVLIGETEPNMDIRLVTLGMDKADRFLFNQIFYIQISDNVSHPVKDKPCMTSDETVTINGREILSKHEIYSKGAEYKTIIGNFISGSNKDYMLLMKKEYASSFADKLNELIIKTSNDPNLKIEKNGDDLLNGNDNTLEVPPPPPPPPIDDSKIPEEKQEIYQVVEEMPQFPGGDGAMLKFIAEHIVYPESAKENGIEGKVYAQFVVQSTGKISDINVLRGIDPSLDAEAVRVIKLFPLWKPGKQNGKPVNVSFTVPIKFELE
jgi:TonB family protein